MMIARDRTQIHLEDINCINICQDNLVSSREGPDALVGDVAPQEELPLPLLHCLSMTVVNESTTLDDLRVKTAFVARIK